ncbi:AAA family ATPase [Methylovorus sp. MM2]|uniref:IS21-like element helper ATPase IstB n=1 Tax=Methylovorus sp. MM2 TaxID=1848038 RepID=UPI0007E1819C|nr:IS21-like element helper ATPase IstB [Methylovorus sp. MM2]OAM51310.1 AAA family ATPase [Methylovorus sp. MM2]
MLSQQTMNKLSEMNLNGMSKGYEEQLSSSACQGLAFEERFGMLVDQEQTYRENKRLVRLLKSAKLKANACMEDIDYGHIRGLDKAQIASLNSTDWIKRGFNLLITGPTGCGKTWIACALGNQACRQGLSVSFQRLTLMLEELYLAHADGSFRKRLMQLAKVDLLILDDFGIATLTPQSRSDLLEVIDSRSGGKSTAITSQLPVDLWHDYLQGGNPTVADAILDRLVSGTLRIQLKGESMRKLRSPKI